MLPASFCLDIYRGDSGRWQFTLWQDVEQTIPFDLTGVVARSQIRDKPGGTQFIAELDCTVTLPNIVTVVLTSEVSFTLPPKGAWDLQLTFPPPTDDVVTPVSGSVAVTMDVTDSTPPPP